MKKTDVGRGAVGFIGRNVVEQFAANPEFDVPAVRRRRPAFSALKPNGYEPA